MSSNKVSYKTAGVDIDKADELVDWLKGKSSAIGGFSGLFPMPKGLEEPMLVASTDGVGTKLLVAEKMNVHTTIGIDLVAMVVNDLLVCGAKPLFFLDYYATGKLNNETAKEVIGGIIEGCKQAECILLGGETAELPGIYSGNIYDLAGFGIGVVDKKKAIDGSKITAGNVVIGLASNGLHSNGYSLAREVFFNKNKFGVNEEFEELMEPLGEELLRPTIIYVKLIMDLIKNTEILGMANITGGGIEGNLCRVLPDNCNAEIKKGSWHILPIFKLMQKLGPVDEAEMYKTFNMGVGMTIVAAEKDADEIINIADKHDVKANIIGKIVEGSGTVVLR